MRSRVRLVLEPSADRQVPVCAHRRAGCGGCGWMHLEPTAQLTAKAEIVRESLRRIGRLDAAVVDDLVRVGGAVDPFGYRTTIRVVGGPDGTLGYREERSDRVVPITSCPIAESALSRLLSKIELDEGAEITLRTSVATGQITAIWPREHRHGVRGVPTGVHIGERAWLTERIAGVDLRVSAGSFFQSGAQGAELVVGAIGRAAPELATAAHAVDAYGGVGLFAATVMATAGHVTLIESSKSACFDAQHNLTDRVGDDREVGGGPLAARCRSTGRRGGGRPGALRSRQARRRRADRAGSAGVRAGQLRPGVARPRRDLDGPARATRPNRSRCSTCSRTRRTSRRSPDSRSRRPENVRRGLSPSGHSR